MSFVPFRCYLSVSGIPWIDVNELSFFMPRNGAGVTIRRIDLSSSCLSVAKFRDRCTDHSTQKHTVLDLTSGAAGQFTKNELI